MIPVYLHLAQHFLAKIQSAVTPPRVRDLIELRKKETEEITASGSSKATNLAIRRPRFPDGENITKVISDDLLTKPDAVIIVGIAPKVTAAKTFTRKMCHTTRGAGGFTAWINIKPLPSELELELSVIGECNAVSSMPPVGGLDNAPAC